MAREWKTPIALTFIILLALTASLIVTRAVAGVRYPLLAVVSESMIPTLRVGDIAVVSRVDANSITTGPEGTIIAFVRPEEPNDIIVHRAYEKLVIGGEVYFRTMGDNNPSPDPWLVPADMVVGRVVFRIPLFGYPILIFKTIPGIAGLIALASAVVFVDSVVPLKKFKKTGKALMAPAAVASCLTVVPYVVQPTLKTVHGPLPWEAMAIVAWYGLSYVYPRLFRDPRDGLFAWIYHTVVLIVPLASDLTYHVTGITPADWWFEVEFIGRPFSPVTGAFYVFSVFVSFIISTGLLVALLSAIFRKR